MLQIDMQKKKPSIMRRRNRSILIEQLEERVLFDAVPDAAATELLEDAAAQDAQSAQDQQAEPQAESNSAAQRRELVIVDTSIGGHETLLDELRQTPDESRDLFVVTIDASTDGIQRITAVLTEYTNLDAVHFISHGSGGEIELGASVLNSDTLASNAGQLAQWGLSLNAGADLLFYGCDLAENEAGQQLIESISLLTGADVAASVDDTGIALRGGDWNLEYAVGELQSEVIVSAELAVNWNVILMGNLQEFYVPIAEQGIYDANEKILNEGAHGAVSTDTMTIISITPNRDSTIIYYDHHEDGFETDLTNPVQSTTEIWGDGDASNGIAPGFAVDVVNAGDIITLQNLIDITAPPPTPYDFDGGDLIASDKHLAVTRAGWSDYPGVVLAGTVEVDDTVRWGTNYTSPIGEDTVLNNLFEYVGLFVMAAVDNTTVNIDVDGDGTDDVTTVLNQGQTYHVDGGIQQGATVTATDIVQVDLITGDRDSSVDSRWYAIKPRSDWSDAYLTPIATTSSSAPSSIVVFNSHSTSLDISIETLAGTVSRTVAANSTLVETLALEPTTSGARISSDDGRDFYAVVAVDTDTSHTAYDSGIGIISEDLLTEMALAGWGPGSSDLSQNGSPIWVTATEDTTVYIDFDGDPSTGLLTDPHGNQYDQSVAVSRLESVRIFDTSDNDQTGTRVYTADGTKVAVAWALDPGTAGAGSPFLDLGTVVVAFPLPDVTKTASLANDLNGNRMADPGDTVTWTITITNRDIRAIGGITVIDTVPTNTSYVAGSTYVDGILQTDSGTTLIPLDEGGLAMSDIAVGGSSVVTFDTVLDTGGPSYSSITNTVTVVTDIWNTGATHVETVNTLPPQMDLDADDSSGQTGSDFITTFTEQGGPISIADADAFTSDSDSAYLTALTVTITNLMDPGNETLAATTAGTNISASYDSGTGVLSLIGTDTLAMYDQVLRTITYDNTSSEPETTNRAITFVTSDGSFSSTVATTTVQISPVNDNDPVAAADSFTVDEGATFDTTGSDLLDSGFSSVLGNDTDADLPNDTLTATLLSSVSHGSLVLNADGTFTYIHDDTENFTDSFTYSVSDSNGGATDTATVFITVTPINEDPIAVDDSYQISPDTVLVESVGSLTSNDFDPEGEPFTVTTTPTTAPTNGTLTLFDDGSFIYIPDAGFTGTDTFEYEISTLGMATDTAVVTIDVVAHDCDALTTDLVAYWNFDDGAGTTATDTAPSDTIVDDGTLTSGATFSTSGQRNDSVYFDGTSGITVANSSEINTSIITQRTVAFWFNADDVNSGRQVIFEEGGGGRGLNIYIDGGSLIVGGWNTSGSESGWGGTYLDLGAVTSGQWHHVALTLDGTATIQPDVFKGYLDGVEVASGSGSQLWAHAGDVRIGESGGSRYPTGSPSASNPFAEFLDDGRIYNRALTAPEITAVLTNCDPLARNDAYTVVEDEVLNGSTVLANDSDRDRGDSLTISTTPTIDVSNGSLTLLADGTFTYTPDPDFNGTDFFVYEVNDFEGGSGLAAVVITVLPTNDTPIANNDTATVTEGGTINSDVIVNDTGLGDTPINVTLGGGPTHGGLTLNADGTYISGPLHQNSE